MNETYSFSLEKDGTAESAVAAKNAAVPEPMTDYSETLRIVESLQSQVGNLVEELNAAQKRLEGVQKHQKHPLVAACKQEIKNLLDVIKSLFGKILGLKDSLAQNSKLIMTEIKERGQEGYCDVMKSLGVKESWMEVRDEYKAVISKHEQAIRKIDAVSSNVHAAAASIKNIGRAATGRELFDPRENGKLAGALKTIHGIKISAVQHNVDRLNDKILNLIRLEFTVNKRRDARAAASPAKDGILAALESKKAQVQEAKRVEPHGQRKRPAESLG